MRRRLVLLVAVTSSLVLVAFLIPFALLVRTVAAEHATNTAIHEAEGLVPLIGTVDPDTLAVAVQQLSSDDAEGFPLTVFLPDGTVLGSPARLSPAVELARTGRSVTAALDGGREVVVAVQGGPDGTAVIRAFVSAEQLREGVLQTWLILGLLGASLLALSLLVADRLARTIVTPIDALVRATRCLAGGDLAVRVSPTGPRELREAATGLNLLANRIGELLTAEREDVADLSHQLRTPLTALRLGVEALPRSTEQTRLTEAVRILEGTVDRVIREARRPVREGVSARCDAAAVTADRVAFWSVLAEDETRTVTVDVPDHPVPVRLTAADLATTVDAILGNVFAHTPEGTAFVVRLDHGAGGGAVLTVSDEGPGFPDDRSALARGESGEGSTGLGLDIVRRAAAAAGGSVLVGRAASGGAQITVRLDDPAHAHNGAARDPSAGARTGRSTNDPSHG